MQTHVGGMSMSTIPPLEKPYQLVVKINKNAHMINLDQKATTATALSLSKICSVLLCLLSYLTSV